MQAQRMREIMDQKAGLTFDNIQSDYGDDDLSQLLGEGKRKKKSTLPKKKPAKNQWNVFLKKALKRHNKTMQDYMSNAALRKQISAEYKRSRKTVGGYLEEDDDEDDDDSGADDDFGGAMIGGAKTKKYKAKKKAYRGEEQKYGVQTCTSNVWYIGYDGKIQKSKCNKSSVVDPTKPYQVKIKNMFKFEDEDGDYKPVEQNTAQYVTKQAIKKNTDDAKLQGKLPVTANIKKVSQYDEKFLTWYKTADETDPYKKAINKAIEKGDLDRIKRLKKQIINATLAAESVEKSLKLDDKLLSGRKERVFSATPQTGILQMLTA